MRRVAHGRDGAVWRRLAAFPTGGTLPPPLCCAVSTADACGARSATLLALSSPTTRTCCVAAMPPRCPCASCSSWLTTTQRRDGRPSRSDTPSLLVHRRYARRSPGAVLLEGELQQCVTTRRTAQILWRVCHPRARLVLRASRGRPAGARAAEAGAACRGDRARLPVPVWYRQSDGVRTYPRAAPYTVLSRDTQLRSHPVVADALNHWRAEL